MVTLSGQIIKGYELRESIGAGGFGVVYRAYQAVVGREVAIKIILPKYANDPDFIRRFETEAQLIARLEHIHIVPLYDYWREPDGAYLVMRYLPGGSLRGLLKNGPIPLDILIRMLDQVAGALALAHRRGVVHRDLKPDNILLDEDRNAYLADFGIAKDLGSVTDTTQENMIIGSPTYIAPEQYQGEPVTPSADIYSLGIMLYELLAGNPPFTSTELFEVMRQHVSEPLPLVQIKRPDLPDEVDMVLQKATAKNPALRYHDAPSVAAALREALASVMSEMPPSSLSKTTADTVQVIDVRTIPLKPTSVAPQVEVTWTGEDVEIENPYKGLRAFQEADAADFFGRDALTAQLLARLAQDGPASRFLAVVGPSGSGKSSAVRAGLVPALRQGKLPGSHQWFVIEMMPGGHPLEEIEIALLRIAANPPTGLLEQLRQDDRGLFRAVGQVLPADEQIELVLVIDQFEEVFTLLEDQAARLHLLASLQAAVSDPRSRLRVIVTLRADFFDRPLLYPGFGNLIRQRTEIILPLSPEELEQAIIGPADHNGLRLESGLAAAIVHDVGDQPGALPLLQYALTELFERRQGKLLTLSAYRASGGVVGALARRADELYEQLPPADQVAARQLFLRLVTLGEGGEDTRRRVRQSELTSIVSDQQALDSTLLAYSKYRLLTLDRDPVTREPTIEVAHEALIRSWKRLHDWLNDSREDLRLQRRLMVAVAEWENAKREPSFLLSGARLEQFEGWSAQTDLALNQDERAYMQESIAQRTTQQAAEATRKEHEVALERRSRVRLRALVAVLFVATLIALGLMSLALSQQQVAVNNAATSTVAQGQALESAAHSESLRLAAESNKILSTNAELAALLGIRALKVDYSPQADASLVQAVANAYTRQLFIGNKDRVLTVALAPDGKSAVTGSADGAIRLWDTQTGKEIRQFNVKAGKIWTVTFSPDGKFILTGSDDSTARLWDVQTGQIVRTFAGQTGQVNSVVFAPNGQMILMGSEDKSIRLWDAQTGKEIRQFTGHTDSVLSVAFSPDGKSILSGSADQTVRLWDAQTGKEIRQFTGHTDAVLSVAFSPDGQSVLTGSADYSVRLWATQTGTEIRRFSGHTDTVNTVSFSPDGKTILTASADKTARIWDVQSGKEVRRFTDHADTINSAVFSADGKYALTGSDDQTARLWAAQPDVEPRQFIGHTASINSVAYSPDGKYVLTGSADHSVRLWDVQSNQEVRRFEGHTGGVYSVAFARDGKTILTGSTDQTVRLWDVQTGKQLRQYNGSKAQVWSVAFSPDGKYVLAGGPDHLARLWDTQTGAEIREFTGHTDWVTGVAFSPDGQYVLTSSLDKTARLWDTQTGKELRRFGDATAQVWSVGFSPDGRYVVTGSEDKVARLWDAQSGQKIRELMGHALQIVSVRFAPDSRSILTSSADGTARLWDVQTGQELRQFTVSNGEVWSVAFSPDGKSILTGHDDHIARLWDADYRAFVAYACNRVFRDLTDNERVQFSIADHTPTCQ